MSEEWKPWVCDHGHVLGQVVRNGDGIRRVMVYRYAIDLDHLHEAPEVMMVVEGLALDIRCSICGGMRTWVPGQEAINILLKRHGLEVAA